MHQRLEQTKTLDKPVSTLRYASGKRLEYLNKSGIYSIRDLLAYYPFRYDDFTDVSKIIDAKIGQKVGILGTIDSLTLKQTRRGYNLIEIAVVDGSGVLKAVWFNQPWLGRSFAKGQRILLLGKLEHSYGYKNLVNPLYTLVSSKTDSQEPSNDLSDNDDANIVGIQPVYHASSELSTNWIKRLIIEALAVVNQPLDPLPANLRIKRRLFDRQTAIRQIHFPNNMQMLDLAHQRLAYEEILMLQLRMALANDRPAALSGYTHQIQGSLFDSLNSVLPFVLTPSQKTAVAEILQNMSQPQRMNRMLLGDVGSGKTMVATYAIVAAVQSGWQATIMAPTEVLAKQYADSIGTFLNQLQISWTLISSSIGATERRQVLEDLISGQISVAFGTHALIEPDIAFKELSLVIVDEQQRFGVEQRQRLLDKNPGCDYLSLTATPIPRSLALVIYGDITTSYLDSRPMPATITTKLLDGSLIYQAYEQVRAALEDGHQAFIVCPLISTPEQKSTKKSPKSQAAVDDADNFEQEQIIELIDDLQEYQDADHIKAAEQELQYLQTKVFPNNQIALLTSKLPGKQKQEVMDEFKAGKIDILVSTTVIEVGIDVPNATVMIIQDADRFGLAQLHQLRGRVGRGQWDSQVFLITHTKREQALDRLKLLEKLADGLKLAEQDLLMRREGDIAGIRQSGDTALSLINVVRDADLINQAHQDCQDIINGLYGECGEWLQVSENPRPGALAKDGLAKDDFASDNFAKGNLTHLKYELQILASNSRREQK